MKKYVSPSTSYDKFGREIGAQIRTFEVTFSPEKPTGETSHCWYEIEPGDYYGLHVWATRNDKLYGPVQPDHYYKTIDDRNKAIEKYLTSAQKRAKQKGGI